MHQYFVPEAKCSSITVSLDPKPMQVVSRLLTGGVTFEKSSLVILLLVRLQWATTPHTRQTLLDSRGVASVVGRLGLPYIVWTDHMNLEYIRSAKCLNSRQA